VAGEEPTPKVNRASEDRSLAEVRLFEAASVDSSPAGVRPVEVLSASWI